MGPPPTPKPSGCGCFVLLLIVFAIICLGSVIFRISKPAAPTYSPGRPTEVDPGLRESTSETRDVATATPSADERVEYPLETGVEGAYLVTGSNLSVVDEPKGYLNKQDFMEHLVTILVPGDRIIAEEGVGLLGMMRKVRVLTHNGVPVTWTGYVPTDLMMSKCIRSTAPEIVPSPAPTRVEGDKASDQTAHDPESLLTAVSEGERGKVPLPPGITSKRPLDLATTGLTTKSVMYRTKQPVSAVAAFFRDEMPLRGWYAEAKPELKGKRKHQITCQLWGFDEGLSHRLCLIEIMATVRGTSFAICQGRDSIEVRDLFGASAGQSSSTGAPLPSLPPGLSLTGISTGERPLAIMADYDRHYMLREGDAISDGWTVKRILSDKVIVQHARSGATTTLALGQR